MRRSVLGVIPARLASTRLPRKMLALINGRPLIYRTWRQARKASALDDVVVATDSREIIDAVALFGGTAVMTSRSCRSGTERVAEAALKFPWAELVINIQGDEPLLSPSAIDAVVRLLRKDRSVLVATVATQTGDERELHNPGNVKVVVDHNGDALYFSRSVIPFPRAPYGRFLKHLGVYGFRRAFLYDYVRMRPTALEKAEKLEQLRILENGYSIRVAVGTYRSISVDTPRDLRLVRRIMKHG